jgi:hypothetical protein
MRRFVCKHPFGPLPSIRALVLGALAFAACGRSPLFSDTTPLGDSTTGGAGAGGHGGAMAAGGHAGSTATAGAGGVTGLAGAGLAGSGGVTGEGGTGGGVIGFGGTGGMTDPCKPGSSVCVEQGFANVCRPNGTWGTPYQCDHGCLNGICFECTPGDVTCLSDNVVQMCGKTGAWSAQTMCANGCSNGVCNNQQCFLAQTRCLTPTQMQSCQPGGTWGAPVACSAGCKADACLCSPGKSECIASDTVHICANDGTWGNPSACPGGCGNGVCLECKPTESECLTDTTGHVCKANGTWGNAFTCATACVNGVCGQCMPFSTACVDANNIRTCNDNGTWDPPLPCPGACIVDQCHSCKPGATQCNGSSTVELCGMDGEFVDTDCDFVCVNAKCGQSPKTVFVTSTLYKGGQLGGLDGADAKCQARAAAANLVGTYRAWLSDSTGSPASRFTQDVGPYVLVNGSIVANNWAGLTSNALRHALDITELGGAPPASTTMECSGPLVWTDTDGSGNLENPGETCGDWSDTIGQNSAWGLATAQDTWTSFCNGGSSAACSSLAPLYCFQQ